MVHCFSNATQVSPWNSHGLSSFMLRVVDLTVNIILDRGMFLIISKYLLNLSSLKEIDVVFYRPGVAGVVL